MSWKWSRRLPRAEPPGMFWNLTLPPWLVKMWFPSLIKAFSLRPLKRLLLHKSSYCPKPVLLCRTRSAPRGCATKMRHSLRPATTAKEHRCDLQREHWDICCFCDILKSITLDEGSLCISSTLYVFQRPTFRMNCSRILYIRGSSLCFQLSNHATWGKEAPHKRMASFSWITGCLSCIIISTSQVFLSTGNLYKSKKWLHCHLLQTEFSLWFSNFLLLSERYFAWIYSMYNYAI